MIIDRSKLRQKQIKYLSVNEIKRFMDCIKSPRDRALFGMTYYYGLRVIEAASLEVGDIDLKKGKIFIPAAKNGISGNYVLTDGAKRMLRPYMKERSKIKSASPALFVSQKTKGHIHPRQIRRLFVKYAKKARIPLAKQNPHTLRHSIAVHMRDSGVTLQTIQMHLRHKDMRSTMIYANISDTARDEQQKNALSGESIANI